MLRLALNPVARVISQLRVPGEQHKVIPSIAGKQRVASRQGASGPNSYGPPNSGCLPCFLSELIIYDPRGLCSPWTPAQPAKCLKPFTSGSAKARKFRSCTSMTACPGATKHTRCFEHIHCRPCIFPGRRRTTNGEVHSTHLAWSCDPSRSSCLLPWSSGLYL